MSGKKHLTKQISGSWIVVCTQNAEMTRADYKFNFCPSCGADIIE